MESEPVSVSSLPPELIAKVIECLPERERVGAVLTCRRWLGAASRRLPTRHGLTVALTGCAAATASVTDCSTSLRLCQCHGGNRLLSLLLPEIVGGTQCVSMEDELLGGGGKGGVEDSSVHAVLDGCAQCALSSLRFERVDFSRVRPWTIALLARFATLEQVVLDECSLSAGCERLLVRALSPSMHCLSRIVVTGCAELTDNFSMAVARSCPNLEHLILSRCNAVTSISVVSLMETRRLRTRPQLTLGLEGTAFDGGALARYMSSPLLHSGGRGWRVVSMHVEIGFEKAALLLEHPDRVCIVVYM